MKKALLYSIILAPLLSLILISVHVSLIFYTPYQGEDVSFTVNAGEGFSSINYRLSKQGIIDNARVFHYYARYKKIMGSFRTGTYTIKKGMHMGEVINTLLYGQSESAAITIPEGKNLYEIGKILEQKGITTYKEFVRTAKSPEALALLNIDAPSVEGYLFPETYRFAPNTPALTVIKSMIDVYKQKTKDLDFSASHLNPHQVIILASIVEKETGAKWERPAIAGVYLNRLQKKMRLQADPTTIYGFFENYNGNLRKSDLLTETPYNTYKINGLPLGPIANPGLAAITATLNPEQHNNLYFVSKNDGTHIFTPTYKAHLEAVKEWQQKRENRTGKSWRDLQNRVNASSP